MKDFPLKNNRSPNKPSIIKNQRGFALLLSLLIIFLLVVVILETDFQARADLRAAGNFRDDLKAYYIARSAISAGKALIEDDTKNSNQYDGLSELWAFPIPDYPVGDGTISGVIKDEERKININKLVKPLTSARSLQQPVDEGMKKQLENLFELLKVDPELVDPIIDWIDADDQSRPFGAESGVYEDCEPSYCPRNGLFETLEELRMVYGMTDTIYEKISPFLTIYGNGKINVNTADREVLQSFHVGIDETEARRLEDNRPFLRVADFTRQIELNLSGVWQDMLGDGSLRRLTIRSDHFLLDATGKIGNTRKKAFAVIERRGGKLRYFRIE